jgi:YD repeat-containing protein
MGRILNEQQCTPSNCASGTPYVPAYTYDLVGNVLSFTNAINTTPTVNTLSFTNGFNGAGRLQSVTSNWSDATHPPTLFAAPSPSYYPPGELMNATLGSGLTLSRTYDNRLRITGETDTGGSITAATSGAAAVAITGSEQFK